MYNCYFVTLSFFLFLEHASSPAEIRISHASGTRETSHSASISHVLACILISEDVEPVDEVQHAVAIYPIIFIYRTTVGCQLAGDGAMILQNVVHLEGQACILEQGLGKLGIPNQFVAVHAAIRISSSALVADVGAKRHLPREDYLYISSI